MSTWPSFRIPLDVVLVFPYRIKLSVVVAGVGCAFMSEGVCLLRTFPGFYAVCACRLHSLHIYLAL